jgi:uncharacterized protein (TIGR02301 family)
MGSHQRHFRVWACAIGAVLLWCVSLPVQAQQTASPQLPPIPPVQPAAPPSLDNRPYDEKLLRLAELLGSVHFLRELCGGTDGMLWRDRMRELLDAEGTSSLRKAKLTRSFNNGYRSYSRTYSVCTPSAQTAIAKFMTEGAEIAETLVKTVP